MRLVAGMALAGLVLGLWLGVSALRRNQAPGPSAADQDTGSRSLDSLKRDAPLQLLDRKPVPVGWDPDNPRWQFWNADEKLLQIMGGPSRLFVVGTTTLPCFDFEVDIKQAPWTGEVGVFWGFHENEVLKRQNTPKQEFAWFHFLRLNTESSPMANPFGSFIAARAA